MELSCFESVFIVAFLSYCGLIAVTQLGELIRLRFSHKALVARGKEGATASNPCAD